MLRRQFLAISGVLAAGAIAYPVAGAFAQSGAVQSLSFELYIEEIYERQTGGDVGMKVAFRDPLTRQINPALRAHEGDAITIKLVNRTRETRSFAIMSVAGTKSAPIKAGNSATLRFTAPASGGYIYHDPLQAKLNESRSLFGDFVVTPKPKAG
jgi:FtsP/CotA-like multicopper oxidase with cupredoxin domain